MKALALACVGGLALVSFACSQGPAPVAASASPDFLRKLQEGDAYRVNRHPAEQESICGQNDLTAINDYEGTLGQPVAFAKLHQYAVGAMTDSTTSDDGKYCSGTLVGPDLYITAGHCIDGSTVGQFVAMNYEYAKGTQTVLPQDYYKITEVVEEGGDLDYAVLRLEGNPGLKYGWAMLRTNQAEIGELISIIQHPGGMPKQIEVGHLLSYAGDYYEYGDLDTEPGSSGSGIVDSKGFLVGIHTNGGCYSSGGSNSGTRLNAARDSEVLGELASVSLPIQEGSRIELKLTDDGRSYALAGEVARGAVNLQDLVTLSEAKSLPASTEWIVTDLADGSFRLRVTENGRSAYLDGRSESGAVALRGTLDPTDFGTKWRIVKAMDGSFKLRTVGALTGSRWLSGVAMDRSVALEDQAASWEMVVR